MRVTGELLVSDLHDLAGVLVRYLLCGLTWRQQGEGHLVLAWIAHVASRTGFTFKLEGKRHVCVPGGSEQGMLLRVVGYFDLGG